MHLTHIINNFIFFQRPVEPKPWTHIQDTLKLPPACLQRTGNITNDTFSYIHRYVPGFNREDENCLYLNLYKPYEPKVRY